VFLLNKRLPSIAPLFQRGVAFLRKSRGADTQEDEVAISVIADPLWHTSWDSYNVASGNARGCLLTHRHEAATGFDNIPFGHSQRVQLCRNAGFDPRSGDRNFGRLLIIQQFRDVTTFAGPDFVGYRFFAHQ